MIVLGADMHKRSHTIAAIAAATGELRGEKTVRVGDDGFVALLDWARALGGERVWALEDCRHVSGSLERFLIGQRRARRPGRDQADERRAPRRPRARQVRPHRRAGGRAGGAARGHRGVAVSAAGRRRARDPAAGRSPRAADPQPRRAQQRPAVAPARPLARAQAARQRAVLKEVVDPDRAAPGARRADRARPDRARRTATPARAHRRRQRARGRDRRPRRPGRAAAALRARLRAADRRPSCSARSPAPHRFATDAKLARAAGVAPIPVSSGKTNRHRLDRGGNRQLNTAIHRIALTRARCHPETQDYLARKRAEGKTGLEAMRCLKRHLTRRIWHLLQPPHPVEGTPPSPSIS